MLFLGVAQETTQHLDRACFVLGQRRHGPNPSPVQPADILDVGRAPDGSQLGKPTLAKCCAHDVHDGSSNGRREND